MEAVQEQVIRIIRWLEDHDREGETSKAFIVQDEPFERMTAEWLNWGDGLAKLSVGYHFEQNGDLVPDPVVNIDLRDDEIKRVIIETSFGPLPCNSPGAIRYVAGILALIFERHMLPRTPVVVPAV